MTFCERYQQAKAMVLGKVRKFELMDYAIYELCIASFASFFTIIFVKKVKSFAVFAIIAAICSYAYLIYKLFFEKE